VLAFTDSLARFRHEWMCVRIGTYLGKRSRRIKRFDFSPGLEWREGYTVQALLGRGWEGEVYRVVEHKTGIHRAAKVFYPERNAHDRAVRFYATKLNRLRKCSIVIQYHHSITLAHRGVGITCLISELVEGTLFSEFISRQPGRFLHPFEALQLLYHLVCGLEQIHKEKEYHGDLHDDNVLVKRRGIGFEVKLVDFYPRGSRTTAAMRDDILDAIRLFYDAMGGPKRYRLHPPEVRAICLGLRRDLILRRFPTVRQLREYLEIFAWDSL